MLVSIVSSARSLVGALLIAAALAAAAIVSPAIVSTAHAGPFEDAVAQFANESLSDTEAAIGAVSSSCNALAYPIISALQDGRLLADAATKKVYIRQADGKLIDAATGAAADVSPSALSAVRLNNRLRRSVEAAAGSLTLLSPDPRRRI